MPTRKQLLSENEYEHHDYTITSTLPPPHPRLIPMDLTNPPPKPEWNCSETYYGTINIGANDRSIFPSGSGTETPVSLLVCQLICMSSCHLVSLSLSSALLVSYFIVLLVWILAISRSSACWRFFLSTADRINRIHALCLTRFSFHLRPRDGRLRNTFARRTGGWEAHSSHIGNQIVAFVD